MTSIFARLCFAAALVLGGFGLSSAPVLADTAAAHGTAAEWSEAEIAELNGILRDLLVPMMNELNTAISLSQSDQPHACEAVKSAAGRVEAVNVRLAALYAQLTREGKDTGRLTEIMGKMQDLKTRMPDLVQTICSGQMNQETDPQVKAVQDKVMGLVRRYSADMTAATNAQAAGDRATACLNLKDGLASLDELEAYIKALAKTYGTTPADAAQTQKMLDQIHQWQAQTRSVAEGCPAA